MAEKEKTNKLNICLVKPDFTKNEEIVKPGTKSAQIPGVGEFFGQESFVGTPDWVTDFFGDALGDKFKFKKASSKALLLVPIDHNGSRRIFAVIFGFGRALLNEGVLDDRFGLRVVLNTVARDSLKSIDKTTLGSTPKQSREQMSREGEAATFGIDIEQDLVNAVTGRSKDPKFGKTISGRDALSLSVKMDVSQIKGLLPALLERSESEDYKAEFEWIDQIKEIRDSLLTKKLAQLLVDRLVAKTFDRIWMVPPAVLDWVDVKGFKYGTGAKAPLHTDLDVRSFLASLGTTAPSVELLKARTVWAISEKTDEAFDHWPAYKCLYAEAEIDGNIYVLNAGKWYEVASSFAARVNKDFGSIPDSTLNLPDYNHKDEGAYNDALAAVVAGSFTMDRKMISYGGGHSKIEFCDLITNDKKLVHVAVTICCQVARP